MCPAFSLAQLNIHFNTPSLAKQMWQMYTPKDFVINVG